MCGYLHCYLRRRLMPGWVSVSAKFKLFVCYAPEGCVQLTRKGGIAFLVTWKVYGGPMLKSEEIRWFARKVWSGFRCQVSALPVGGSLAFDTPAWTGVASSLPDALTAIRKNHPCNESPLRFHHFFLTLSAADLDRSQFRDSRQGNAPVCEDVGDACARLFARKSTCVEPRNTAE